MWIDIKTDVKSELPSGLHLVKTKSIPRDNTESPKIKYHVADSTRSTMIIVGGYFIWDMDPIVSYYSIPVNEI